MSNSEKVFLTDEGFLELETELNELKNVKRPAVIKALKEARALGDLSENAGSCFKDCKREFHRRRPAGI